MHFAECLLEQSLEPEEAATLLTQVLGRTVTSVNDLTETLATDGPHVICTPVGGQMRSQLLVVGLGADAVIDPAFFAAIGDASTGSILITDDSIIDPAYFLLRSGDEWTSVLVDLGQLDEAQQCTFTRVVDDAEREQKLIDEAKTPVGEARAALLRLSSADPLLKHAAKQFEFDWGSDTPTSALGSLGQTFVDHFDQIDAASKAQLFATVEALLTTGSPAVGDAVATGFLEAVATRAEAAKRYDAVTRLFGPRACEYVNAWNAFCGVDTPPLPVASNQPDRTKEQRSAD